MFIKPPRPEAILVVIHDYKNRNKLPKYTQLSYILYNIYSVRPLGCFIYFFMSHEICIIEYV